MINANTAAELFWLAGAGKTKLTANVINHLSNRPDGEAVAYFYCNRNEELRRDPENVLRCFVKQLAISRDKQAIRDIVVEVYKGKQDTGFASAQLTYKEAEALLPKLMRPYSRTMLVLDALDECQEQSRLRLIATFNRLIQDLPSLKIFVSSRRDGDIKHQLEKNANLGIEATDNKDDIAKFVHDTIEADRRLRRLPISDGLRDQIVQTLLHKSRGM
jgi:predicted NACHT family NTPase